MPEGRTDLTLAYVELLRQGPPFLRLLDFARRCVEQDVTATDLLALHLSATSSPQAADIDLSMSETLLTIVVSFRSLLSLLQESGQELQELEQDHADLAILYRTKSRTLSMVAHDLSGYLVSTRMMALSMARDTREDMVRDRCGFILKALEDQEHLVANLLNIGKIEAGGATALSARVDLKAVIARCVESARKMSGHTFSVIGPALQAQAEEDKVRQILENLVGNAVKFSPSGGLIEIELSLRDDRAAVAVRDHGIGIDPDFIPHLFEPYYRDSKTAGTGLGLSIVKSLIDLMHGDVFVESNPGGTTVQFTLPLANPGSG